MNSHQRRKQRRSDRRDGVRCRRIRCAGMMSTCWSCGLCAKSQIRVPGGAKARGEEIRLAWRKARDVGVDTLKGFQQ